MNICEITLAVSHPHRSRAGTAGWGAWRMLWRVREWSRPSSPSQLWVAGPLSPYNVIDYLFCTELLLYSKDVTFDPVLWFIICVRLGPSTPGDYDRVWVLVPQNPGVTTIAMRKATPQKKTLWRSQVKINKYQESPRNNSVATGELFGWEAPDCPVHQGTGAQRLVPGGTSGEKAPYCPM
jgi:hypothetical protein